MTHFIYGRWPVLECLRAGRREMQKLLVADGIQEKGVIAEILGYAQELGVDTRRVPRRVIDDLAHEGNHQGVVLRTNGYPYVELEDLPAISRERGEKPFFLALDLLKDPQNVGVLLRVADAVGVHGIILQTRRGVEITSSVVAASSGAVEHLAVAQVTNLVNALKWFKEQEIWIIGMDIGPDLAPADKIDMNRALVLVLGSEGEGMRRLVRETCDILTTLPMRGEVESLNVATVGSIVLYQAWSARDWAGWSRAEKPSG